MGGEQNVFSLDKYITYPIAKVIAPFLYNIGIKPNHITISNIFFRIFIFNKILNNDLNHLLYFLLFSHFLDCLDGTIARKFNLVSNFGAFIDQLSDKIFWGGTILLTLNKCKNKKKFNELLLSTFLILCVLFLCHFRDNCFLNNSLEMNAIILIIYYYTNLLKCSK